MKSKINTTEPKRSGNQLAPDFMFDELDKFAEQSQADGLAFEYCSQYIHAIIWWDGGAFSCNIYRNGNLNKIFRESYPNWVIDKIVDHFGHE